MGEEVLQAEGPRAKSIKMSGSVEWYLEGSGSTHSCEPGAGHERL